MDRSLLLTHPSKEEMAQLPPYERLPLDKIHLVRSERQANAAIQRLAESGFVGFDTETKPVFSKDGGQRDGPHLIQIATLEEAFLIPVNASTPIDFLREVLESQQFLKVGFGLKSDRGPLLRKLGIRLAGTVELAQAVKRLGYRQAVGVKAAVAIVLGQRLQKSKKATTSNWALHKLSDSQIQYAADDAHAALAVFHALGCPLPETRASGPNPSLEPTRAGMALGPPPGVLDHPSGGPSAIPALAAQLKR